MRSFNFKNGFKQCFPIKTYSINKTHALLYYTTQWIFIILRKFIHMALTSPNEKMTFLSLSFMKGKILLRCSGKF